MTAGPVLTEAEWRPYEQAHVARVDRWLTPAQQRKAQRIKHPIEDFLYVYYPLRSHAVRRWSPGFGIGLQHAPERHAWRGYAVDATGVAWVSAAYLSSQVQVIRDVYRLSSRIQDRHGQYGCFGLHEWAMVYQTNPSSVRHQGLPLRLPHADIDDVVSSHKIACSHFDAFRFFTPGAAPLNTLQPSHSHREHFEQPACLHANMDLYKHCGRLTPLVSSDLLADCLDLAHRIRLLDMRASPYDVTSLGYEPITVETASGKAEYVSAQRQFADESAILRQRLIDECRDLLRAWANLSTRPVE